LGGAPAAAKLMAEMLWMLLLFPSRLTPRKKREMITEVYRLSDDEPPGDSPFLTDMVLVGLGYPGAAFSIHRLKELNYLITLAQKFKALSPGAREQVLRNFL
jgi:5-methylcytosine-specific restriction enzyme B